MTRYTNSAGEESVEVIWSFGVNKFTLHSLTA